MNHIDVMDDNYTPIHLRKQGKMCRSIICFGLFTLSVMTLIYFVKTGNFPRLGFE